MFRNVRKEMITVPAQMSYLSQVRDFIDHIGKKYKFTDRVTNSFKLVVDEACTNVIRHGYRDIKGGEITIKAIIRRQSLTIVLIDQGNSYDPRQANMPDLEKYIQIGKKGGLGILMMRKLMDDLQYNITSRGNELRLTKQREILPHSGPRAIWENLTMRTRYTVIASAILTFLVFVLFTIFYSRVDQNTLEEIKEVTRAQTLSLADNSSDYLERGKYLDLFMLTRSVHNNNPELIYEAFITDSMGNLQARSAPLKEGKLGKFEYPVINDQIADTTGYFRIDQYSVNDTLEIFDFAAEIRSGVSHEGSLIGYAHIWIPVQAVQARAQSTKVTIIIIMLITLIIGYLGSYFLIDRIVTPFHSLADWVRQVGQGTVDDDEIDIDASDELGEIAQAFNQMTTKFREAQVNLIEQQRLQKELQVAQEIQQMLLPNDFPLVKGYELASYYEAAKEVGGDLFDFVEVDEDTIGICVADVAGKGVPGSLIMTMIRTALRLEARGNKNPAEVLSKVNHFVTGDMRRGMFVTMFYLVLDSRNRIIHYASAGHNPMILYRGSSKQTYYLNPSGFPVGIQLPDITLFDRKIEQDSIRLREDDLLVLYTDGITEAMNPKRELYREERFLDAIRNNAHFDVAQFVKVVKEDVKHHTKGYPQNDDITYVAIKEKLMYGEVIYSIQKELFRLIDEEGMTVKDACEEMRVSQYMYRKYKTIKDSIGLEGLKELLYKTDYIEKKHLSIEVKTKILEVIRQNPEFGAKRISDELKTDMYGNINVDDQRIYLELKKLKLNTQEKREQFVKRGGKKRIKLPGTPLMTMDGQVILNYESAEKTVSDRRGIISSNETARPAPEKEEKKPREEMVFASVKNDELQKKPGPVAEIKEKTATEQVQKEEKPFSIQPKDETVFLTLEEIQQVGKIRDAALVGLKTEAAKIGSEVQISDESQVKELKEKKKKESKPEIKATKSKSGKIKAEADIAEKQTVEKRKQDDTSYTRVFDIEFEDIDPHNVEFFYTTIKDDLNIISSVTEKWTDGKIGNEDLARIVITLKIVTKNPNLNKLGSTKQIFEQVKKGIEFLNENKEKFRTDEVMQNVKEMLNYIEKENILKDADLNLEKINELGLLHHNLAESIKEKNSDSDSEMDAVRKKIKDKKLLRNLTLLENMAKESRE